MLWAGSWAGKRQYTWEPAINLADEDIDAYAEQNMVAKRQRRDAKAEMKGGRVEKTLTEIDWQQTIQDALSESELQELHATAGWAKIESSFFKLLGSSIGGLWKKDSKGRRGNLDVSTEVRSISFAKGGSGDLPTTASGQVALNVSQLAPLQDSCAGARAAATPADPVLRRHQSQSQGPKQTSKSFRMKWQSDQGGDYVTGGGQPFALHTKTVSGHEDHPTYPQCDRRKGITARWVGGRLSVEAPFHVWNGVSAVGRKDLPQQIIGKGVPVTIGAAITRARAAPQQVSTPYHTACNCTVLSVICVRVLR